MDIAEIVYAPAGTKVVYHTGLLSRDRDGDDAVKDTGNIAWKLYEKGTVCLVQRRLGFENYEYIAVKRGRTAA